MFLLEVIKPLYKIGDIVVEMDEIDYWLFEYGLMFFILLFITFLSFFESALHNLTGFDLKLLNEQNREKQSRILYFLAHEPVQVIIPLNFGIQAGYTFDLFGFGALKGSNPFFKTRMEIKLDG